MILERLLGQNGENRDGPVIGFSEWLNLVQSFGYNGVQYTTPETPQEQMAGTYAQLGSMAYQQDGIVFACMVVRQMIFRQMRFQFRRRRDNAMFGDVSLQPLERPWPGGTTSDLLARAILHHDLGGNAFFVKTRRGGMALLRPDWVDMVIGSNQSDASAAAWDPDASVVGYVYHPGGRQSGLAAISYLDTEVAHWAMQPDPLAQFRGMSWLTPVVREIMGDKAATDHKLKFFENSATPNMLVKIDTDDISKYEAYVELWKRQKEGVGNAYSTAFTARGVDASVIGKDMRQMDFKEVQGAGEVRIAAAAQTPPVIVGLSEGLSGSSLNTGNFTAARRLLVDGLAVPLWENVCGTLDNLFDSVNGGRLWPDTSDVALMKEDQQDAATIQATKATSLNTLLTAGYEPDSSIKAIIADDFSLLIGKHSGLFSVQLQAPGSGDANDPAPDNSSSDTTGSTAVKPSGNGTNGSRSDESDYLLRGLLLDIQQRARETQPHVFNITTPPTTVEIGDGAVHNHVTLELPPGEGSRTEFAEGSFQTHVTVEPSPTDIRLEPSHITVEPTSVNVEPAEVRVDANITVEPSHVTVEPVSVNVEPADVRMEIAPGAVQTDITVEPADIHVDVQPADVRSVIEEGAIQMTVEPADVSVEIEAPPIEVNIENRAADIAAPVIQVEPTPVTIENNIDLKAPDKIVRFTRDGDDNIIEASTEDADPEETV